MLEAGECHSFESHVPGRLAKKGAAERGWTCIYSRDVCFKGTIWEGITRRTLGESKPYGLIPDGTASRCKLLANTRLLCSPRLIRFIVTHRPFPSEARFPSSSPPRAACFGLAPIYPSPCPLSDTEMILQVQGQRVGQRPPAGSLDEPLLYRCLEQGFYRFLSRGSGGCPHHRDIITPTRWTRPG